MSQRMKGLDKKPGGRVLTLATLHRIMGEYDEAMNGVLVSIQKRHHDDLQAIKARLDAIEAKNKADADAANRSRWARLGGWALGVIRR